MTGKDRGTPMENTVFIHTNAKQIAGAHVAAHSLKRNSRAPDNFDVRIIKREDYPWFEAFEGKTYLREGRDHVWHNDDLQSFTPLRFMPPELMGYQGRAVVIDPDVFAVGDINELLARDMGGKAIMAKPRPGHKGYRDYIATSVMLLDCAKLTHWNGRRMFEELFARKRDYEPWMRLADEPRETIGDLEPEWNDFDRLSPNTKLLHNTKRRTQPWKTGLPIDYTNRKGLFGILPANWTPTSFVRRRRISGSYWRHPDNRQEQYFFSLLKECLDNGSVTVDFLKQEMAQDHVRHDALDIIGQVPTVDEILDQVGVRAAA